MPLFTVINPTQAPVGSYAAFSRTDGVNLNNNQAGQLVGNGLVVMPNNGSGAKAAFALLSALMPGIATPKQRKLYRIKGGAEEFQELLRLMRTVDQ